MKAINIRREGFKAHYERWLSNHPDAIPYKQLIHYIRDGDEFGRRVPIDLLAEKCKTSKGTMLKWLQIIKEELGDGNYVL